MVHRAEQIGECNCVGGEEQGGVLAAPRIQHATTCLTWQCTVVHRRHGSKKWQCMAFANLDMATLVSSPFGLGYQSPNWLKGNVGNAILDTKGKIVLALFSVCNKQTGVS